MEKVKLFCRKKAVEDFTLFYTFFTNNLSQKVYFVSSVMHKLVDCIENLEDHNTYWQWEVDKLQERSTCYSPR